MQGLLPSCVPLKLYRTKPLEQWAGLVTAALTQVNLWGWLSLGSGPGGRPPSGHRNLNLPGRTALQPQVYPGLFHQHWLQAWSMPHILLSWHHGSGWLIPLVLTAVSFCTLHLGTGGHHQALT